MDENYNTAHSASYEGVSPARVLSGITNFYDEGIKPKGNVSYSLAIEDRDIKPIGEGAFGPIYDQFKGKPYEAVDFLAKEKSGFAKGVFYRKDIGDIGLIWGDNNKGLAHIQEKHIVTHNDFKSMSEMILVLSDVVNNGDKGEIIVERDKKKVPISKGKYVAFIALSDDGNWALTTYDGSRSVNKKKVNANISIIDQDIAKAEDGTHLLPSINSADKDTTTNPKNQIPEQESFSLNLDDVTIATPEMEAEANFLTLSASTLFLPPPPSIAGYRFRYLKQAPPRVCGQTFGGTWIFVCWHYFSKTSTAKPYWPRATLPEPSTFASPMVADSA